MTTASPATLRHSISLDSLIAFGYDRTPVGRRELAKDTLGRVFGYIGSILCGARFITGDKRHPTSGFTRKTSALGSKGIFAFPGFLRLNDVPLSTESSPSIDDFLTPQCQAIASSQDAQPSCWKPFEHLTPLDLVDEAYMAPIPWPNEQRCFSGGEPLIPSQHSIHQGPHSKRVYSGFHREDDSCYPLIYSSQASQSDTDALQLILALNDGRPSFYTFEQPPTTVLDLGCGDGAWILHAKNVWKDTQFVGQDLIINASTMSNDRHRVQLVEGNFLLGLPYATATFDYIRLSRITMGIPCWLWEPFLREVHRVLTPDGIVEIIDDKYYNAHVCRCSQCNESGFLELETQFRRLLGNRHVHEIHRIIPVYRGHFFGTVEKSIHEVGISFKSQCLESGKQPKPRMKSITTSRLQATFPIPRANTPVSRPTSPISRVASPIPSLGHSLSRPSSPAPPSYEEATRRKRRHSNASLFSTSSSILGVPQYSEYPSRPSSPPGPSRPMSPISFQTSSPAPSTNDSIASVTDQFRLPTAPAMSNPSTEFSDIAPTLPDIVDLVRMSDATLIPLPLTDAARAATYSQDILHLAADTLYSEFEATRSPHDSSSDSRRKFDDVLRRFVAARHRRVNIATPACDVESLSIPDTHRSTCSSPFKKNPDSRGNFAGEVTKVREFQVWFLTNPVPVE